MEDRRGTQTSEFKLATGGLLGSFADGSWLGSGVGLGACCSSTWAWGWDGKASSGSGTAGGAPVSGRCAGGAQM